MVIFVLFCFVLFFKGGQIRRKDYFEFYKEMLNGKLAKGPKWTRIKRINDPITTLRLFFDSCSTFQSQNKPITQNDFYFWSKWPCWKRKKKRPSMFFWRNSNQIAMKLCCLCLFQAWLLWCSVFSLGTHVTAALSLILNSTIKSWFNINPLTYELLHKKGCWHLTNSCLKYRLLRKNSGGAFLYSSPAWKNYPWIKVIFYCDRWPLAILSWRKLWLVWWITTWRYSSGN